MPKDTPFDPCRQWLGIDAVDLGNARLVLGVASQETDALVVRRAAEARLNLLRTISPGPFEMARAGLIKRVEEAREKLLAEIAASPPPPRPLAGAAVTFAMPAPPSQRASAATVPPPMPQGVALGVPPAVPPAVPSVVPPPVPGAGVETIAIRTTVYRKKTPVAGIALTVLALSGVAGALFYYNAYGKLKGQKSSKTSKSGVRQTARAEPAAAPVIRGPKTSQRGDKDEGPVDPTSDRAVSPSKPPSPGKDLNQRSRPEPEPEEEPMPAEQSDESKKAGKKEAAVPPPKPMRKPANDMPAEQKPVEMKGVAETPEEGTPADAPPAQAMAKEDSQLEATLAETLEALRSQEHDKVAERLAEASEQAGSDEAKQRVAGWKLLATYYKGFLEYREKALATVKPGDEYDVKNQKIAVVEVDDKKFIYQVAGGTREVPRNKIPGGIVLAIVMQWFDANPANDLYVGAYHLAKPESDPPRAREHWEKALAAGADSSALLPLLDDPVFAKSE
jgi:hypothetical protein